MQRVRRSTLATMISWSSVREIKKATYSWLLLTLYLGAGNWEIIYVRSLDAYCEDKFSNSGYEFAITGLRKNWINKIVQLQVRTAM